KAWPVRSAQCRPPSPPPPASPPASKAAPRRADRRPSPSAGSPARPRNTTEKPSSPSPPRQPRPLPSSTHPPPESEDHDRFSSSSICHANFQSIALDENHEALAAGDAGVEKVPLQHGVVLGQDWDNHGGILGALAFVDGGGVGRNQRVEFAKPVGHRSAVKIGDEFAGFRIHVVDVAYVAVVDLLVVVVFDLH